MKSIPFPNEKTPYRVITPASRWANGKRKTFYFPNKDKADDFCRRFKKFGPAAVEAPAAISKTDAMRFDVAIQHAAEKLGGDVSQVYAAIEHWMATRVNIKPATVQEAVTAFQVWRKRLVDAGELSLRTWNSDRGRLLRLVREFKDIQMVDLTTLALREFLDTVQADKKSVFKSVHLFFKWATDYKFLGTNPIVEIKSKEMGSYGVHNDFYKVDTFRRMLRIAAGLEPVKPGGETTRAFADLLPYFILGGFFGLRSCETYRITGAGDSIRWTDLYFERDVPFAEVRAEIGKKTRKVSTTRYVKTAHSLEAAKSWLGLVPNGGQYIVERTEREIATLKRAFQKATKIKFLENGFRNSYATYSLTVDGEHGIGKLSLEMGNTEAVCKRHYIQNIEPGSGRAWFNLRPFEVVTGGTTVGAIATA
jgi:hypothetical protein